MSLSALIHFLSVAPQLIYFTLQKRFQNSSHLWAIQTSTRPASVRHSSPLQSSPSFRRSHEPDLSLSFAAHHHRSIDWSWFCLLPLNERQLIPNWITTLKRVLADREMNHPHDYAYADLKASSPEDYRKGFMRLLGTLDNVIDPSEDEIHEAWEVSALAGFRAPEVRLAHSFTLRLVGSSRGDEGSSDEEVVDLKLPNSVGL